MAKDWQKDAEHWHAKYQAAKKEMGITIANQRTQVSKAALRANLAEKSARDLALANDRLHKELCELRAVVESFPPPAQREG